MPTIDRARTVVIVLAAGAGARLGSNVPKAFLPLGEHPMVGLSARSAAACDAVDAVLVTVPRGERARADEALAGLSKPVEVIEGGDTRHASVFAALRALPEGVERVACHDAARPFAPPDLFTAVLEALDGSDGADGVIPVLPVADTIKRVRDGIVVGTEARDELGLAQTPQAFRVAALREAHHRAAAAGLTFTDDAAIVEWAGYRVRAIAGDPRNFKVTTVDDLARAERRSRDE